ncbi:MAG TPA: cyclic nucleotide-binding domain-containing protein [Actinomycetota bacterium]|nr:cyclic nucleotide-binding domain-containing protein [Actinomycetota bacterium]
MGGEAQLASVPLFSRCSRRDLKRVAGLASEVTFEAGDVIAEEGEDGLSFYVVLEGEAKVTRRGKSVARLLPGSFFGEVSLLDGGPRTATVTAVTPMRCLSILRWDFRSLLEKEPALIPKILKELALRLRQTEKSVTG